MPDKQYYESRRKALRNACVSEGWYDTWKQLQQFVMPRAGVFDRTTSTKGQAKGEDILNNRATRAARTLGYGMAMGLANPARPWARFTLPDPDLQEYTPVRRWLDIYRERMMWVFARSNVYKTLPPMWRTMGVFGTPAVGVFQDFERVIRTQHYPIGSYFLATDANGDVNTFYRDYKATVKQLVDKFGLDRCSRQVRSLYESRQYETQVDVVHLIEPNDNRKPGKGGNRNMPYRSVHYESGGDSELLLSESGFEDFQVLTPRWDVDGQNVYGDSPGMDLLGDIKQLQTQELIKAMGSEKSADPPMGAPASLQDIGIQNYGGGVTYYNVGAGSQKIEPLFDGRAFSLTDMRADIAEIERRIAEGFFEDLFLMLSRSDRRQITAREVAERHEEKLLILGPVVHTSQSDGLSKLTRITGRYMEANGLVPPRPPEMAEMDVEVEYISLLAQAQRLVETSSIGDTVAFIGNLSQAVPAALDKLDVDQAIDEFHDAIGAPASIIRSDEEVAELRQARQQQEQMQAAAEAAAQAAQGAKLLSETETRPDNLLGQLFGP